MKEQLISFETAKLAKEKGFTMFDKNFKSSLVDTRNNEPQRFSFYRVFAEFNYTRELYPMSENEPRVQLQFEGQTNCTNIYGLRDSYESPNDKTLQVHCFLAPTQSLLQKWFWEKHKLFISLSGMFYISSGPKCDGFKWYINDLNEGGSHGGEWDSKTPEEALEIGLQEALKLI
jgi:hypothetical protein